MAPLPGWAKLPKPGREPSAPQPERAVLHESPCPATGTTPQGLNLELREYARRTLIRQGGPQAHEPFFRARRLARSASAHVPPMHSGSSGVPSQAGDGPSFFHVRHRAVRVRRVAYCGPTPIADEGSMMARPRRCRICRKGPPWQYRNCPPGVYKRCYHAEVWPDRPAAREQRRTSRPRPAASGQLSTTRSPSSPTLT